MQEIERELPSPELYYASLGRAFFEAFTLGFEHLKKSNKEQYLTAYGCDEVDPRD